MFKLRNYQLEMKAKIYKAWSEGFRNVLLVMPTGMGKTVTFCSVTSDMAIEGEAQRLVDALITAQMSHLPTAILVHRKELVSQICLTLAKVGISHNIIAPRPVINGITAAERRVTNKSYYNYNATVTVVSVDTLNARIERHRDWASRIRLWIIDEAAHVLAHNKWGEATTYFPHALGLGVTATPERLDRKGLGRQADGVFDHMVLGPSTRWAIQNGYLADYEIVVPPGDFKEHLKEANSNADYTRDAMAVASKKSHIVGDAVKTYLQFANGKQCITFATDVEAANEMERAYLAAGVRAKTLTGETRDAERLQGIIDFENKVTQVLINVDLFDEGLDCPGIEVVQMCRPTKATGKFLQMIGRGLRPVYAQGYDLSTTEGRLAAQANGPKPKALLIDHVGNLIEHDLPDRLRTWTLERTFRGRSRVNLLYICKTPMCWKPYDRTLSECPFCGSPKIIETYGRTAGLRATLKQLDGDLVLLDPKLLRENEALAALERPEDTGTRVAMATGNVKLGEKAMAEQLERIRVQQELAAKIAQWAGPLYAGGYTDRRMHIRFYAEFDMTVTEALSGTRAQMISFMEELQWRVPYV